MTTKELSTLAGDLAAETERGRRLPDELVAGLRDAGLLRAGAPSEVGGLELSPALSLQSAEQVARGDASAGWCVSIAITSSLLAAYLPDESRAELFGGGRGVAAGVWAPRGKARPADGGLAVSGRWAFCSGISHADLLFAGCIVEGDSRPSVVAIPKQDLEILDTWHTLGLRGTGSHDAVADDVLVPANRVFSLFDGPLVDRPLYRFPIFGFFALSIAAAALGNARAAIDDLVALAVGKVGQGSSRTLAERAPTQTAVAAAEATLSAARALYYEAIDAAWGAAQGDEPVSVAERSELRLAATHAVRASADVARSMYELGGGSAIYDDSSLQRRFRDAHTATAHFQVNEASRELPGRILLGQPADPAML
jgi:indole-3-acetate monooxygenase